MRIKPSDKDVELEISGKDKQTVKIRLNAFLQKLLAEGKFGKDEPLPPSELSLDASLDDISIKVIFLHVSFRRQDEGDLSEISGEALVLIGKDKGDI
jgi:hypothetical protein